MQRKYVAPGTRLPLIITSKEHAMMIDAVLTVSLNLEKRIALGEAKKNGVALHLTLDEIDELDGCIAAEANHCKNKSKQKRWYTLFGKIHHLLETYTDEETPHIDPNAFSLFPPEISQQLKSMLANNQFNSLDEANEAVGSVFKQFNQKPKEEFGGLSSDQVSKIINCNWDDPHGIVRFNQELPGTLLNDVRYLQNTRKFLSALAEEKKLKATATGNLPRKFITHLVKQLVFPRGYLDDLYYCNKVINEQDVSPLHIVRILSEIAGLIKMQKNTFSITKKGTELLHGDRAGNLFALLFKAHYKQFNLAYLDGMPENQALQDTITYSLYMLKQHFQDWRNPDGFEAGILLPAAYEEALAHGFERHPKIQVSSRILRQLEEFGLLQRRKQLDENQRFSHHEYKLSPLFNQFIQFMI